MEYACKDAERTEDGRVCVKNPSAFWLPEFTLQKETGGTVYSVTGAYDGTETLDRKMARVMAEKFTDKTDTEINFAQGGKGAYWDPAKNQT